MGSWWSGLDKARKLMVIAIALMTFSQFLDYLAPTTEEHRVAIFGPVEPNLALDQAIAHVGTAVPGQTGWEVHPYAWLFLIALVVLFLGNLSLGDSWKRWGYWIGVAGLALCLYPFDMEDAPGWGLLLGVIAFGVGIWSARLHGATSRSAA